MREIREKFIAFVSRNFMVEPDEINLDKSLIDEGIIDSFGLIEIASFLENEYAFTIDESDMIRANFGSVNKIVDFTLRKLKK